MREDFKDSIVFAECLRFTYDKPNQKIVENNKNFISIQNSFYKNGLEVQKTTIPQLHKELIRVLHLLHLPESLVKAFVYASPEIQAECYSSNSSGCIIRMSSGLVQLLTPQEISFVLGHEIGHFLFNHKSIVELNDTNWSLSSKSQEISADRLGLYTCGSIDVAIRAMMKITSGLGDNFLSFNINDFIAQFNKIQNVPLGNTTESTHPSIGVRSRALLWFSLTDYFKDLPAIENVHTKESVDTRIQKELSNDYDGQIGLIIQNAKDDYYFWSVVLAIVQFGKLEKTAQETIKETFGADTLKKLKNYLQELAHENAEFEVSAKVEQHKMILIQNLGSNAEAELNRIASQVKSLKLFS